MTLKICFEASSSSAVHAGMQKLVGACPVLASREEFRRINNLHSIDCISTRLWFDRRVSTQFPANVLGKGFEDATGGTFFNLNDLQVSTFPPSCILSEAAIASASFVFTT